jgi:hypothetical protein
MVPSIPSSIGYALDICIGNPRARRAIIQPQVVLRGSSSSSSSSSSSISQSIDSLYSVLTPLKQTKESVIESLENLNFHSSSSSSKLAPSYYSNVFLAISWGCKIGLFSVDGKLMGSYGMSLVFESNQEDGIIGSSGGGGRKENGGGEEKEGKNVHFFFDTREKKKIIPLTTEKVLGKDKGEKEDSVGDNVSEGITSLPKVVATSSSLSTETESSLFYLKPIRDSVFIPLKNLPPRCIKTYSSSSSSSPLLESGTMTSVEDFDDDIIFDDDDEHFKLKSLSLSAPVENEELVDGIPWYTPRKNYQTSKQQIYRSSSGLNMSGRISKRTLEQINSMVLQSNPHLLTPQIISTASSSRDNSPYKNTQGGGPVSIRTPEIKEIKAKNEEEDVFIAGGGDDDDDHVKRKGIEFLSVPQRRNSFSPNPTLRKV